LVSRLKLEESLERRIRGVLREAQRRGFETVVFVNEVINQNPGNFVYVCPEGVGDEQQTLVLNVNGDRVIVAPHWGAKALEEGGRYSKVIPIRQEKSHHMRGTQVALTGYNPDRVCFDLSTMSAQFAHGLSETLSIPINPKKDISDHVFTMRSIKDEYEVEEIRRAIKITEEAVRELVEASKTGANTWDLKKSLDASMIAKGAIGASFDSTISFTRGAKRPYGIIEPNDILSVDVGCRADSGYCSDMGRTWPVKMDDEARDFLERAVVAQREGIRNIREGVTGNEVLRKANRINEELGFDPAVRCGHQVGLDVHDYTMPFATNFGAIEQDAQPLRAGMTVTYEPTRVDSKLGIRAHIEDIVLVTRGEPVLLNKMPWNVNW
jgi:Xaa-Pro aminopeptidase